METCSQYGRDNHINENKQKGNTKFLREPITKCSLIWVGAWSSFVRQGYYLECRHKRKQESFRQGRKRTYFPMRTVWQWSRSPWQSAPSLSLEAFKPQPVQVLSSLVWPQNCACLGQGVGLETFWCPFTAWMVLWSYFPVEMSPEHFQQTSLVMHLQIFLRT